MIQDTLTFHDNIILLKTELIAISGNLANSVMSIYIGYNNATCNVHVALFCVACYIHCAGVV